MVMVSTTIFLLIAILAEAKASAITGHERRRRFGNALSVTRELQAEGLEDEGFVLALPPQKPSGDEACPCLSRNELEGNYAEVNFDELTIDHGNSTVNYTVTMSLTVDDTGIEGLYGLGCAPHDLNTEKCQNLDSCTTVFPVPKDCDNSWCQRSWCYVDRANCGLHFRSALYKETDRTLYYSYATCGHLDVFQSHYERVEDLGGKKLRVGYNSNSGGWMGSYNREGSFANNGEWKGPLVEYMLDAALDGNFTLVNTAPPPWLYQESRAFWGSSSFDFCVYAVALGYLDMCVSAFTITPQRAAVTPFFELASNPIYLVTFLEGDSLSGWEEFKHQAALIYQPFDNMVWVFIFFFCIPTMGLLMLFQEYGSPGMAYSNTQDYQVRDATTGTPKVETRPYPMWRHSLRAVYTAFYGFIARGYRVRVFTIGGKLQLMSMLSFILLSTTVYTANLAAQFVVDAQRSPVDTLEEALEQGYNFCAQRNIAETILTLYNIDRDRLVIDPVSEGGDGKPGFSCSNCAANRRVLDFMKQNHDDPSLYCDAAFVAQQHLTVFQQYGLHCNKTIVGDMLSYVHDGIPINSNIAEPMTAQLYDLKYNGVLAQKYKDARPKSICKVESSLGGQKKQRLTIQDLTGIWVAMYSLALAGLIAKVFERFRQQHMSENKMTWRDQWGNALPNPEAVAALEGDGYGSSPENQLMPKGRQETAGGDGREHKMFLPHVEDDLDESE